MSKRIRLTVPMPVNVTNKRGSSHWRIKHQQRRGYFTTLDVMQMRGELPAPPLTPWERVTISSTMHLGGAMDDDNALARHKPVMDWLVTRGYLAGDRKKNITWASLPDQIIKRDKRYRIVLTITPHE